MIPYTRGPKDDFHHNHRNREVCFCIYIIKDTKYGWTQKKSHAHVGQGEKTATRKFGNWWFRTRGDLKRQREWCHKWTSWSDKNCGLPGGRLNFWWLNLSPSCLSTHCWSGMKDNLHIKEDLFYHLLHLFSWINDGFLVFFPECIF